ncbi:CMRF35-like molecule 8 isoform X2 [Loxodonta africana]|uniref:CMRF35-like molecule 8 isoform X2 n=1 Tax=Loxodonta africana TaxID=9785 RepID=UPI000C8109F8|nr:CMRF35-like molecule 8 isoform X2 [Loxodonta africana]
MTQEDWALWLPSALLLLWVPDGCVGCEMLPAIVRPAVASLGRTACSEEGLLIFLPGLGLCFPGCLMLSGPSTVTGIVGESLSVQCRYEEKFKESNKYWCREPALRPCYKIVETSGSEREKRRRRVSISDHPAQLSFTVTMTNLTVEDAGKYWCGIDITWLRDALLPFDPTFQVVVSVSPAEPHPHTSTRTAGTSSAPARMSSTPTSTTTSTTTTVLFTRLATAGATHSRSSQEKSSQSQGPGILVLLSLLAVLLLLLVGASLLVWRMVRRQVKVAENAELSQNSSWPQPQPFQPSEPCYENLELQTHPPEGTLKQRDMEVEYSLVAVPRAEPYYASVTFVCQSQDSEATSMPPKRPQEEPEYSVIKKT